MSDYTPTIPKQVTYDRVATHLLAQGKKATDDGGDCLYRAPDGCKCAAGILIPDDKYDPTFEHAVVDPVFANRVTKILMDEGHDLQLVRELQHLHDKCAPCNWRDRLARVAKRHNLSTAVLDAPAHGVDPMPKAIKFPKPGEFTTEEYSDVNGCHCLAGWARRVTFGGISARSGERREEFNRLISALAHAISDKVNPGDEEGSAIRYNDDPTTTDEGRARIFAQAATAAGFVEAT